MIRVKTGLLDEMQAWLQQRGQWTQIHQRVAGRACFEMARTLAKYDRAAAAEYHRDRRARQMIHLEGPAAPLSYQLAYRTLGFASAETLASR